MKIARYQRQVRLPCRIAIIPAKDLTQLAEESAEDTRIALSLIDGWIINFGHRAHCIGCGMSFADTQARGFAISIPAKTNSGTGVCAGICRRCMSKSRTKLYALFGRAMSKDGIATLHGPI
jgi:hypothetical protein